jgi:hypothetical protein
MRKAFLKLLALGMLSGCANIRQQQAQTEIRAVTDNCKSTFLSQDAARVISGRTAQDARDITPSMLADRSVPSETEIEAVKALEPVVSVCQKQIMSVVQKYEPVAIPVFEASRVTALEITSN